MSLTHVHDYDLAIMIVKVLIKRLANKLKVSLIIWWFGVFKSWSKIKFRKVLLSRAVLSINLSVYPSDSLDVLTSPIRWSFHWSLTICRISLQHMFYPCSIISPINVRMLPTASVQVATVSRQHRLLWLPLYHLSFPCSFLGSLTLISALLTLY